MSMFDLILQNPSIAQLAELFPHLRRFVGVAYADRRYHRENKVGMVNNGRVLVVDLTTGEIERLI